MSEERKVFCTECGAENNGNFKFCSTCGAKLEQSAPAQETPVVETPMVETPVMDALASDAAAETVYSGESTPYSSDVPFESTTYTAEAPATEEIQINYSQDNGSFSGNTYEAQPQYYTAEPMVQKKGNKGFAIASLICGILAVICCCFSCVSLVLAIAAIALGIVTLACKYDGKGMAIAGIVMGGLGILMFVAMIFIGASDGYTEMMDEIMNELY
ncbi:MAG: DUF4190 domain-containing protein [Lachnospiraceae bacterium]|nr:DUF4190 domain-containing protein [Lachnospiraceae bacterium]